MSTPAFLRLTRATKRFGGVVALDAVDWDVMPGEVHCLVGENGSGKSTMIKLVSGVHQPDAGWRTLRPALTPTLSQREREKRLTLGISQRKRE